MAAKKAVKKFDVFVGFIGDEPKVFEFLPGATVADVLKAAGLDTDERDVRLDAVTTKLTARVKANQIVTVIGKVEGGSSS